MKHAVFLGCDTDQSVDTADVSKGSTATTLRMKQ